MFYTGYADFWFPETPLPERVGKFAALGVQAVNVWAWRSKGMLMDDVAVACREHGVIFGDTFDEQCGNLTDAHDHALCLDAWAETIENAQVWGVQRLFMFSEQVNPVAVASSAAPHIQGFAKPHSRDYTPMQRYANLLEGVAKVMALIEKTNLVVWFESLNTWHLHGHITCTTHELAADVVRRINHPQLRLSFDCYHQQRTAGNLIQGLRDFHGLYDTVHIGDVPTRGEPGTGEINFANLAHELNVLKFDGSIGLEFYCQPNDETNAFARVRKMFER